VDDVTVTVKVLSESPSSITIGFYSNNREGLYDWGQNKRNSKELFKLLPWNQNSSEVDNEYDLQEINEIYQKFKDPENGITLSDKTFMLKKFEKVFSGSEATVWMNNSLGLDSKESKKICNDLLKAKLISHCSSDLLPFTEVCFYRLS